LPTASAPDTRHKIIFKKNRKTIFADGFFPGRSAQDYFQKNRKTIFADGFFPGRSAQDYFQKK
jgi:hypothetical protein